MKKVFVTYFCLVAVILISAVAAQTGSGAQGAAEATLPYIPSLDVTAMDKSVDPCVDLYHYSCGGWQKKNPIPADQTSWSVYAKLYQDNLNFLRGILQEAAANQSTSDPVTKKIGAFYGACMDEATVEKRGAAAIRPQLDAIAGLKSVHDLAPLAAQLTLPFGRTILFAAGSTQDPDNSVPVIGDLDQGGIGLPDRDYYLEDDAKSKEIRQRYVQHVQKVFGLLGESPATAKQNAETIMRMETELAKASWTRVERRDPYKLKNKMKVGELNPTGSQFRLGRVLPRIEVSKIRSRQRGCAQFLQAGEHIAWRRAAGKLEELSAISCGRSVFAISVSRFFAGKFRVLPQGSARRH